MDKRIAPKKNLGQNFLTSATIAHRIASALGITPDCHVLEIGPGEGALTSHILEFVPKEQYTAVEFDPRAAELVEQKFNVHVVQGDFLAFPLKQWAEDVRKTGHQPVVIGNIPYNITSPILLKIFDDSDVIDRCVLMMQREVAQRLVAKHNSKEYGILSVRTRWCARAEYKFTVAPGNFFPPPKVHSAVVAFDFTQDREGKPTAREVAFVRAAFSQRRKKLGNSLKTYITSQGVNLVQLKAELPEHSIAILNKRAEQLSPQEIREFYKDIQHTIERISP